MKVVKQSNQLLILKMGNEIFIYYHNIRIIMIEADYNKWLEIKSKIENFDKISETNKKEFIKQNKN